VPQQVALLVELEHGRRLLAARGDRRILVGAGFTDVTLRRNDAPFPLGDTLEDAIDFALAVGPAGEIVRLAGDEGVRRMPEVRKAAASVIADFVQPDGVRMPSSVWIVSARA